VTCILLLYLQYEFKISKILYIETVNLFLSTPRRHTGKAEIQVHSFLTLALGGGVNLTSRLLYSHEKLWYPMNRRLNGHQNWSGWYWRKNKVLLMPGLKH
jgi:hypothetical protein